MADRRSWLWRRRSSEKGVSGSDTSLSPVSSPHSDRCSDEQEALKSTSSSELPQHGIQSEVSVHAKEDEDQETLQILREKLTAALSQINAKEDLVKQHAKVAEEAVAGWEQAEIDVTNIKQQLEASYKNNSILESQVNHLDGALKECVRQLRQSREEQEEKIRDALAKKLSEWESEKSKLKNQNLELQRQLEVARTDTDATDQIDLQARLQIVEKENRHLRIELLAHSKDLQMLKLERDLSNQAAEAASKQHLESVKKLTKMESECRKLQYLARQTSSSNDAKLNGNAASADSLTDSQSDGGERTAAMENGLKNTESWASALIAELDQFKNVKSDKRNVASNHVEIDIMDDFLEMERLAALPEVDRASSSFEIDTDSDQVARDNPLKPEVEYLRHHIAGLQAKVEKVEEEKDILGHALGESKNQLELLCDELVLAQDKLAEMQMQLNLADEAKLFAEQNAQQMEAMKNESVTQLETALLEVRELNNALTCLKEQLDTERALSDEYKSKSEAAESAKVSLQAQLHSVTLECASLHETLKTLEATVGNENASVAAKLEAAESTNKLLEVDLQKLRESMAHLEAEAVSAESAARAAAANAIREALEAEIESNSTHVRMLREKVALLEVKIENERALAAEFASKMEAAESSRKATEHQLEVANLEIMKLSNEVSFLQGKVEEEKVLSEEFAAKCWNLEAQISRDNREAKFWRLVNSSDELKAKQEKELAAAAGKLADCQKTIASLGQQLRSLADLDELGTLDTRSHGSEKNGNVADLVPLDFADTCGFAALSNGGDGSSNGFLPFAGSSSPPSNFSVFSGVSSLSYNDFKS